jgi:hypothetical protein
MDINIQWGVKLYADEDFLYIWKPGEAYNSANKIKIAWDILETLQSMDADITDIKSKQDDQIPSTQITYTDPVTTDTIIVQNVLQDLYGHVNNISASDVEVPRLPPNQNTTIGLDNYLTDIHSKIEGLKIFTRTKDEGKYKLEDMINFLDLAVGICWSKINDIPVEFPDQPTAIE